MAVEENTGAGLEFVSDVLLIGSLAENEQILTEFKKLCGEKNITLQMVEAVHFLAEPEKYKDDVSSGHAVTLLNDGDFHNVIMPLCRMGFSIGFVPISKKPAIAEWLKMPSDRQKLFELALQKNKSTIDLTLCNGVPFLGSVSLGQTPFLTPTADGENRFAIFSRLSDFFRNLRDIFSIKPFPVTIISGSDSQIKTAITGMVILENNRHGRDSRLVQTSISGRDGKLSVLLISPRSLLEYLSFLISTIWFRNPETKKLPAAVSYIKTDSLKLVCETGEQTCRIDGETSTAREFLFQVEPGALRINVSEEFTEECKIAAPDKNTMKIENLPQNEQLVKIIEKHLPFFSCASEEEFKDLLGTLRNNAGLRIDFLIMMLVSSVVAGLGLFLNSPAVIIGAMILAPLMGPILSLAMGMLRRDSRLVAGAVKTILSGIAVALSTSGLMAFIIPVGRITAEMAGRIQPSLLDLGVAVAAGAAGAYANTRDNVSGSLPGVAIAVALVPPLCVSGIGLGWGNFEVFSGAMLLFLTNLIGISLASAVAFMILGFAPVVRARFGLGISLAFLLIIGFPLTAAFNSFQRQWLIEKEIQGVTIDLGSFKACLDEIQIVESDGSIFVKGFVNSPQAITKEDLIKIRDFVRKKLNMPVRLELSHRHAID